jgi:hypothetical protein
LNPSVNSRLFRFVMVTPQRSIAPIGVSIKPGEAQLGRR